MKTTIKKLMWTAILAHAVMFTSGFVDAAKIAWTVGITPVGGGTVEWHTSSPVASGILSKTGTVTFDSGAFIDLTFKPQTGYQLTRVYKNTESWLAYLDANKHFQFGPVGTPHVIGVAFTLINPSGNFDLNFPDGKATSVVDVTGNYNGVTKDKRNYNADVAMDEAGKLAVLGTADGIAQKGTNNTYSPTLHGTVGSIKTVNNVPTAQGLGSFTGTKDGVVTTATGTGSGPVVLTDAGGGSSTVTAKGSGTAHVGATPYSAKPTTGNLPVTPAQKSNLSKTWDLDMTLREVTNPTTLKKSMMCSSILNLPNGDKTFFPERLVTYTAAAGYTVTFTTGIKLDTLGNQILDPKTGKPVRDTKSWVNVTRMLLSTTQGNWFVKGGIINYRFLGQTGKGNVTDFAPTTPATEVSIFTNGNVGGVINKPTAPTTFTTNQYYTVTYISTYHWNNGKGKTPGRITLKHQDGTLYGPWQSTAASGQGGVVNANWEYRPWMIIKPGTYTVIDSDPLTWAQNATSGGQGFVVIRGIP
jgi:hypothetical protein